VKLNRQPVAKGNRYGQDDEVPPMNDWVRWDADGTRQYIDAKRDAGASVVRHGKGTVQDGFKGTVVLTADLFGDWREEIITALPGELRIYSTAIPDGGVSCSNFEFLPPFR
jgi:hypothetical protein